MAIKTNEPRPKKDNDFGIPPRDEFKPLERRGMSGWSIVLIALGIMLTAGAGIGYWFFHSAAPAHVQEEASTSDISYESREGHEEFVAEEHDAVAEQASLEATLDMSPAVATQPREGTITRVSTPQGFYYVVVGSFIDDDLAADYATLLAQQGLHVTIVAPKEGAHFFRVAVECENTFYEAYDKLTQHKATYGSHVWLLKH